MNQRLPIRLLLSEFIFLFLLFLLPCGAQTIPSDLVQIVHTEHTNEGCTGACSFTVPLPNATLSNNLLKLDFAWHGSGISVSNIYCNSDSSHATWTWTVAKSVTDTTYDISAFSYYVAGAAAGCTSVTIVASSTWSDFWATFKELREIVTSSPVDAIGGQVNSATSPAFSASVTTTVANDWVDEWCTYSQPTGFPIGTSLAMASSGFTNLDMEISYGYGGTAEIDKNIGSVTGTETWTGGTSGDDGVCTMVAFKTSPGAGTSPMGTAHIVQQMDQETANRTSNKVQAHLFNAGDSLVFMAVAGVTAGNNQWTAFSDSLSNSFTSYVSGDSNGWYPEWAIDCNAANVGDDLFSLSSSSSGDWNIVILEISGLQNSSHTTCYDSSAKLAGQSNGTTCGSSTCYTGPTITPSLASDLVLASINEGLGPIVGFTSPLGATYNYPLYTGQTDASDCCEGGGYSIMYNAGTNPLTWKWESPNNTTWGASVVALKVGSSSGTRPDPPTGLQASVQ